MEIRQPEIDIRSWGTETRIGNFPKLGYCGKLLNLKVGYRCSIHRHKKSESLYLESGLVYFEMGEDPLNMDGKLIVSGSIIDVHNNIWHRFSGLKNSVFIEFSTPDETSERYNDLAGGVIPNFDDWKKSILK